MSDDPFSALRGAIHPVSGRSHLGTITHLASNRVEVGGLSHVAHLGDEVMIEGPQQQIRGEITWISAQTVVVTPFQRLDGIGVGTIVRLLGMPTLAPSNAWVGRVIDPFGMPLDGRPLQSGNISRSLQSDPPPAHDRRQMGTRLTTGMPVFDTMLPLAQGQRVGLFAGSGVGKTTLIGRLARQVTADVTVIALIGERGRELSEFVTEALGPEGLARSVIVAATSDMAPNVRRRCALAAMTVAEHFRQQGAQVLLLADSITRLAEAHREIALMSGEDASMRGFPPSLTHMLAGLCERAGPGTDTQGDITAIFSVLVSGSDMDEPVADITRGLLDGHIVLSRDIAERGRFPAVDVLRSVSRSLPAVATNDENAVIGAVRKSLGIYAKSELMITSGLYDAGTSPQIDDAIRAEAKLDAVFAVDGPVSPQDSFTMLQDAMAAPVTR